MIRPNIADLSDAPESCKRVISSSEEGKHFWIGPADAVRLGREEKEAYESAHTIMKHIAIQAPLKHKSGHPGGPLSAFTFSYFLHKRRNPHIDQPFRMSAGHLSLLNYTLLYLFGRDKGDKNLESPQAIIESFRTSNGLPGHIEAGVGEIPFGTGPLGKGLSNALGAAFGLKYQNQPGVADILIADGDAQEGQIMEAFRLAAHLETGNLIVHGDFNDMQLSSMPSKTMWPDFAKIAFASGWHVIEVENGNEPGQVAAALDKADELTGKGKPIFICYYTTMGYGIDFMEEASNKGTKNYHGTPLNEEEAKKALANLKPLEEAVKEYEPFRIIEKNKYESASPVSTDIELKIDFKKYKRAITAEKGAARIDFGAVHIKNLMAVDDRIIVLHADLAGSGGFDKVEKEFPDRVINVGVAEANMYMMAAGLRQTGLLPVTYTFAAFGTNEARANARLIDLNSGHTRCAILNDCTHTGLSVGEDGQTHQDLNYFNIPFFNTQVWMPADSNQSAAMAERALEIIADGHQSVYIFSPRTGHEQLKSADGKLIYDEKYEFGGRADMVRGNGDTSDDITIFASGICVHDAVKAADSSLKKVRVMNVSCIRPLDSSAVISAALETSHIIVVEDHNAEGGLATQISDVIADFSLPCTLQRLGAGHYFPSSTAENLKFIAGLDSESIANAIEDEIRTEVRGGEDSFVTAIYELANNRRHSRFGETSHYFVEKIKSQKGYLESLRNHWKLRACPANKLPTNGQLIEKLSE